MADIDVRIGEVTEEMRSRLIGYAVRAVTVEAERDGFNVTLTLEKGSREKGLLGFLRSDHRMTEYKLRTKGPVAGLLDFIGHVIVDVYRTERGGTMIEFAGGFGFEVWNDREGV